ncbi:MAG: hypothetical protein AAB363_03625 [Planctomycetota bacterium]
MAGGRDRLVRRIQRRQQSRRAGIVRTDPATPREIAELEDRVRRLHALGVQYGQVRLSREVALSSATRVPVRVGGECVATEV